MVAWRFAPGDRASLARPVRGADLWGAVFPTLCGALTSEVTRRAPAHSDVSAPQSLRSEAPGRVIGEARAAEPRRPGQWSAWSPPPTPWMPPRSPRRAQPCSSPRATGSPGSRTTSSPRPTGAGSRADRLRLRHQPVRPHPSGQPARDAHAALRRRRDPPPRPRRRPPALVGRLRPVPPGAGRHRPARGPSTSASRSTAVPAPPGSSAANWARALQGAAAGGAGAARRRGARRQPDPDVHLRRLRRADPAGHARAAPHIDAILGRYRTRQRRRMPRPRTRVPARRPRTTAARRSATSPTSRTAPAAARTPPRSPGTTTPRPRLTYVCDDGFTETVLLRELPPRQARVEGRLADALGLRGRRLRALGRRPPVAGLELRRGWPDRAGGVRRRAADRPDVRLRRHQRHGEDEQLAAAPSRSRSGRSAIMEAPLLRWLYARRRPNQAITVAFDQEVQRLYDEWDALSRKHRAGAELPAGDVAGYSRAAPAPRPAPWRRPRTRSPYRTLASVADVTTGDPAQTLRILRDSDPADPVTTLDEVRPRLDRAATWVPPTFLPSSAPTYATSPTPHCWPRSTTAARGAAAARRRARRALVAGRPDDAGLRRPQGAGRAARRRHADAGAQGRPAGPSSRCSTGCSSAARPGPGCPPCCSPSAPTGSARLLAARLTGR